MKAIEVTCRECYAQGGAPCTSPPPLAVDPPFHPSRIEDEAAMSSGGNVSVADFDRAVDESGLF